MYPPNGLSTSPTVQRRESILELEDKKEKMSVEYEEKIEALRKSYESEQESYARLQADIEKLKSQYDKKLEQLQDNNKAADTNNSLSPQQQEALQR